MIILLHSSKTMKRSSAGSTVLNPPQLLDKSRRLDAYLKTLSIEQLSKCMQLSPALAAKTKELIAEWTTDPVIPSAAIDSFVGDIYSGLRAQDFSVAQRKYANKKLRILSGLYGVIQPYDSISPYRLEMGYKLPDPKFANLYRYWGSDIANSLPATGLVLNLSSVEYAKAVIPYLDPVRIITPKFLTHSPKTGQPVFVTVHSKIARGALARWVIQNEIDSLAGLEAFADIGYRFCSGLSTPAEPVFVCREFGGLGLSVRLK